MHTYISTIINISAVSRTDDWPTDKHKLITKQYKAFTRFTNQISFDKLNAHNTLMTYEDHPFPNASRKAQNRKCKATHCVYQTVNR